jgi:hypothetical protein
MAHQFKWYPIALRKGRVPVVQFTEALHTLLLSLKLSEQPPLTHRAGNSESYSPLQSLLLRRQRLLHLRGPAPLVNVPLPSNQWKLIRSKTRPPYLQNFRKQIIEPARMDKCSRYWYRRPTERNNYSKLLEAGNRTPILPYLSSRGSFILQGSSTFCP